MGRAVLFLLIVFLWGCDQPPAAMFLADPDEQAPAGIPEPSEAEMVGSPVQKHNFGVAKPSTTLTHDFVIENNTTGDWTLAGVKTSCSCTIATPDWKVIPAGQKKSVTVELQTGSSIRFTPITHTVEVNFREPAAPHGRLSVSALVRDTLYITPERVVLADLGKGASVTRPIVVANYGDKHIAPPQLQSNVPWITAEKPVVELVEDGMPSAPLQRFRYDVQIVGKTLSMGHHTAQLTFEPGANATSSTVAVEVDVRQSIAAIPSRAFFGRIAPGKSGELTLVIRSPENSALDETAIHITTEMKDQLRWTIEKQSPNTARLNLTLKPTATEGLVHGEFIITYGEAVIPVPVDTLVTP